VDGFAPESGREGAGGELEIRQQGVVRQGGRGDGGSGGCGGGVAAGGGLRREGTGVGEDGEKGERREPEAGERAVYGIFHG
jgi:hypothetical protein